MKVTSLISNELSIDIRSLHIDSNDGVFHGTIAVHVTDRSQLSNLANLLKGIKGIDRVEREFSKG